MPQSNDPKNPKPPKGYALLSPQNSADTTKPHIVPVSLGTNQPSAEMRPNPAILAEATKNVNPTNRSFTEAFEHARDQHEIDPDDPDIEDRRDWKPTLQQLEDMFDSRTRKPSSWLPAASVPPGYKLVPKPNEK